MPAHGTAFCADHGCNGRVLESHPVSDQQLRQTEPAPRSSPAFPARGNPPRLPLGLALGCARTTYHRQLRSMHQKRPWPESHFVIPACLRTDIHLLPVFECGNFCDGSGPPEWEAGPLGEHKCSQLLHTRTAGNGEKSNSHVGHGSDSSSRHYAASITTATLSPSS